MFKQSIELAFLNTGIPARLRKRKDNTWYIYPYTDNRRFAVATEKDVQKLIETLKQGAEK